MARRPGLQNQTTNVPVSNARETSSSPLGETIRAAEISATATKYAADVANRTAVDLADSARRSTSKSLIVTSLVTLMVAVSGIVGTYLASTSAVREQAERQAAQSEADYLRQEKTTAYVDFAAGMQDLTMRSAEVARLFDNGQIPSVLDYDARVNALKDELEKFAQVSLLTSFIASEDVRKSVTEFQMTFNNYYIVLTSLRESVLARPAVVGLPGPEVIGQVGWATCVFLENVRVDLSGEAAEDC